jgi:hypothetical protein
MAQVLCEVSKGLRESEATVSITTLEGRPEFLPVDRGMLSKEGNRYLLSVGLIHMSESEDAALVELPDEADSGAHRIWVKLSDLRQSSEAVP